MYHTGNVSIDVAAANFSMSAIFVYVSYHRCGNVCTNDFTRWNVSQGCRKFYRHLFQIFEQEISPCGTRFRVLDVRGRGQFSDF